MAGIDVSSALLTERVARARGEMARRGIDVLLLSVGADLPYLTGYEAMPLERLTMLVLPSEGDASLVVPRLEAPRVVEHPDVFGIVPWAETDHPVDIVAGQSGRRRWLPSATGRGPGSWSS
jgi:Xaa-Pro aminopeptidase